MKKIFFLTIVFGLLFSASAHAATPSYQCDFPRKGDLEISGAGCVLPSGKHTGIDAGNITIDDGATLQMEEDTEIIFEPGQQINVGGYILRPKPRNAIIRKEEYEIPPLEYTLVFECGSAICVADNRGGPTREVYPTGQDPEWSPDGMKILFRCGVEICTINPDGRNLTNVTDGGAAEVAANALARYEKPNTPNEDPRWSPDGMKILFECGNDVCIVDVATSKITEFRNVNGEDPEWSPNGTQIAFDCGKPDQQLCLFDVETGTPTDTANKVLDFKNRVFNIPGCDSFASTTRRCIIRAGIEDTTVSTIPVDSLFFEDIQWSPDGKFVATEGVWPSGIGIIDVTIGNVSLVGTESKGTINDVKWSPDGQYIAYECNGICSINLDTQQITRYALDWVFYRSKDIAWFSDSQQFVYDCNSTLCIANIKTGESKNTGIAGKEPDVKTH